MPFIRIPKEHWDEVWWELVKSGPISRVTHDYIYFVGESQVRLLRRKKLPFELVAAPPNGPKPGKNHAAKRPKV